MGTVGKIDLLDLGKEKQNVLIWEISEEGTSLKSKGINFEHLPGSECEASLKCGQLSKNYTISLSFPTACILMVSVTVTGIFFCRKSISRRASSGRHYNLQVDNDKWLDIFGQRSKIMLGTQIDLCSYLL